MDYTRHIRCDADGVPCMLQYMQFNPGMQWFEVMLFDRSVHQIEPPIDLGMELSQCAPTRMQAFEMEQRITRYFEEDWPNRRAPGFHRLPWTPRTETERKFKAWLEDRADEIAPLRQPGDTVH